MGGLEVGQWWFIQIGSNTTVSKAKIIDVTKLTVRFMIDNKENGDDMSCEKHRYMIEDIHFIESTGE
ncbi:MAG: hypothetical protein OQK29_01235 [Ignavibacteriaceae bacterium]|nr:hypothetical protein [Ignavibacteriaceae bacterium]